MRDGHDLAAPPISKPYGVDEEKDKKNTTTVTDIRTERLSGVDTKVAVVEERTEGDEEAALIMRGREIYVSEGCWYCHTQQTRTIEADTVRSGWRGERSPVSTPDEFVYDAPHMFGTRRVGPDLSRVGGKYDNLWHYLHLMDPRSTSPASNMPMYTHFKTKTVDPAVVARRMGALRQLGTPYTDEDIALAAQRFMSQGQLIADDLAGKSVFEYVHSDDQAVLKLGLRQGASNPDATLTAEVRWRRRPSSPARAESRSRPTTAQPRSIRASACPRTSRRK